jgi:predicted secreted Zn-dependent protease
MIRRLAVFLLVPLLAAAAGLGLAGSATAVPPPATGPLAGIPNLDVQYYDVSGSSVAEIRAAINRVRPRDPNDGVAVDALNRWYISWRWPGDGRGNCLLGQTELRFTATLRMPRLFNSRRTPRAVVARWQAYVEALIRHEAGHLRHAYANMGSVLRAIRASSCATANEAGRAAVRALAQYDVDYDRATRHGFTQGAHFP